ncbi:restriction endonuclease subunit S [Pseudomonas sp. CBC3]|uniref:restriction endonuclease subunit S n=1 Tax=Pseudomonas sp. CBC3 TaxID=3123318 RepID=UPI0040409ECD
MKALESDEQLTASQKYGVIPQRLFSELEGQKVMQVILGRDILKKAEVNDFVISMRSFQGGLEFCSYSGAVSSAYVPLYANRGIDNRFFKHLFKSVSFISALQNTSNLVRDGQALRYNNFVQLSLPFPSLNEQRTIGEFLDHETARIDALIEEQQRLIELLKEKRQAVISHAVTKGLNPTVPMKDSGVEWLGEVPAHWTVAPIKFFFEFLDGQRIPIKAEDRGAMQGDYPYYGASGIIDYVNDFIFEEDLVLVSEDGANLLMRSTPIAFVAQGKYWVNNHAHIIRPQDDSLTYWVEVIEQQDLTNYVTGSAQPKLTAEALGSIKIAVPPTGSERAAIQAFILEIDAELGALLTEAACGVRLLQERRSALISAAVTGKIDVRGWQPPVSTPATEPAVAEAV